MSLKRHWASLQSLDIKEMLEFKTKSLVGNLI